MYHAGWTASLLLLEQIQALSGAQASCLWGNQTSRLVEVLFLGRQDARGATAEMAVLLRLPVGLSICVTVHSS